MHAFRRLGSAAASAVALLALAGGSANALAAGNPVFVQTDSTAGNHVVAYDRAADGTLSPAGSFATGGLGGALEGSVTDHLASQGSLAYDPNNGLLYAVNAGSDTVSVFAVLGDKLALRQVIASGGSFPVSVAVHGSLVYVLNALEGGAVAGFRVIDGRLEAIPGSTRALGLNPTATPQFVNTPGQVVFTPDGSRLIVTTKANGNDVDVFRVGSGGRLHGPAAVTPLPGDVPFAVAFDKQGHVLVTEAGPNALAVFELTPHDALLQLDQVHTEGAATCWIAVVGAFSFTSNTGSSTLSVVRSQLGGQLLSLQATVPTDSGTVDAAATPSGRFLYAQTGGAGLVDEYAIGGGGALTPIGSVTVPGAVGGEGIVAP
jgi:DNA-binding beta-propeller fold protein YncE